MYTQRPVTGDRTEGLSFTEIDTLGSQESGIIHCTYGAMTLVAAQDELLSPPRPQEMASRPCRLRPAPHCDLAGQIASAKFSEFVCLLT